MGEKSRNSDTKPFARLGTYLAANHHGKARTVLRSTAPDGDNAIGVPPDTAALVIGSGPWPHGFSPARNGAERRLEGREGVMTGRRWTVLAADLLEPWRRKEQCNQGLVPEAEPNQLGPFALAYLKALVRIADWRASENPSASTKPSHRQPRLDYIRANTVVL